MAVRLNEEPHSDDARKLIGPVALTCTARSRAKLARVAGASYGPLTSPIPELCGRAPSVRLSLGIYILG
ncbi:hypothetical protein BEL01nite_60350 [Bradyrhizobium elkanii]|nr:hypothetical protein BEL01nite_60350 [Bradyrhizobium elkanii]